MAWHLLLTLRRWLRLDEAMGKRELLSALTDERAHLSAMLARLDDSQMVTPGVQGNWSVKDILAHMSAWDRRGMRWLKERFSPPLLGIGFKTCTIQRFAHIIPGRVLYKEFGG